jgi:hypothetical protein
MKGSSWIVSDSIVNVNPLVVYFTDDLFGICFYATTIAFNFNFSSYFYFHGHYGSIGIDNCQEGILAFTSIRRDFGSLNISIS